MILTRQQMTENFLKILEDSVKDFPENEKEEAKATILNAFGQSMFKSPNEPEEKK